MTDIREKAIALIEQLPSDRLTTAIEFLEKLHDRRTLQNDGRESALLKTIQRRLSNEERARLNYLREREENGVISETEHQQLLAYIDRLECQDAERAEALLELSRLRGVDLRELIAEFLPESKAY